MSPHPPPTHRSRGLALGVLSATQLMIILDGTIVNVALPTIQADLGFTQSGLAWVVNAFLIGFGGLLLLAGRLGDLIGRRRMLLAGLGVFTAASVAAGLAPGPEVLLGARFVQGVGGAFSSAVVLGMIVTLYPDPRERARAFGLFAFVGSAGASIGVLAGGVLTEALSWHWIFLVNVPVGLAVIALAVRALDADRGIGLTAGADAIGAVTVTGGLMLGVATIVQVPEHGWTSARTLGFGGAAVLLLAGFVVRQALATNPLLSLHVFRSRQLSGGNAVQILMVAALFSFQFLSALYLQSVLGYGPLRTGLSYLAITAAIGTFSLGFSARFAARFGARAVLLAGLTLLAAGFVLLTRLPVDGSYAADVLPAMLVLGTGFGLAMPQLTTIAMSGTGPQDAGLASGLFNTTQQVGGAVGLAVLATIASSYRQGRLADGATPEVALVDGFQVAFTVGAGLVVAAIVVAAVTLRPAPPDVPTDDTGDAGERVALAS